MSKLIFDWHAAWLALLSRPMALRPCPVCWGMVDETRRDDHQEWHEAIDRLENEGGLTDVRVVDGQTESS